MGFFSSTPSVTVAEAAQKLQGGSAVLIDVRSPEEYARGHAHGARNYPLPSLSDCVEKLKDFAEVYVICHSGARGAAAVSVLRAAGIPAINVSGGTSAWQAHGLPSS